MQWHAARSSFHGQSLGRFFVAGLVESVVAFGVLAGCRAPALPGGDNDVNVAELARANDAGSAPSSALAASAGYPVDTSPPKDFHDDALLGTLAREAAAVVVCRLNGLRDIYGNAADPDIFYASTCDVSEVLKGTGPLGSLRFIWQVERGSRLPPPGSELLVYLKQRKERLKEDPELKWMALDTGVLRYTDGVKKDVHQLLSPKPRR